ncbi:DUF2975 domain-containing protein [Pseudonocardia sp.]|uniref:DUF2975 domain-containing protein n=1 Tax=Pseudonocardia sp. TaxID=60912 RepID=UPI0031FBE620
MSESSEHARRLPQERVLLSAGLMSWVGYLLLLVALAWAWGLVSQGIQLFTAPLTSVALQLPPSSGAPFGGAPLPPGVQLQPDDGATGTLYVPGLGIGLRLLAGLGSLLSAFAVVLGAWLLRRVMLSIGQGRPFDPANTRRLAVIAGLVLLGGAGASLLTWVGARGVLAQLHLEPNDAASPIFDGFGPFGLGSVLVALVVLACAEAFRRGRQLAEDADGLI